MLTLVRAPILSTLPGHKGSNPKIVNEVEATWNESLDELLAKILPYGAVPGEFFINHFRKERILTYTFEIIHDETRSDLASISFLMDKLTNVENLKSLITEIFRRIQERNLLSLHMLNENLEMITNALNKKSKLKIGNFIFDIAYFLKTTKQKLADERRVKGRMI